MVTRLRPAFNESRKKKRITQVLPVDCRVAKLSENRSARPVLKVGEVFGGRTINLSRDGLLINSDYELEKGTELDISLAFSETDKRKMKLGAKVAWSKRNAFNLYGRWAMGMRITRCQPDDLEALAAFFKD